MDTLEKQWQDFTRKAIPPEAKDKQRRDMKTCFYCGAVAIMALFEAEAIEDPTGEFLDEFVPRLKAEMRAYIETLGTEYEQ